MSSKRQVALPWTRVISGPFRGTRTRSTRDGVVLARLTCDAHKASADAELRARGYLVVDAPTGCQFESDAVPPPRKRASP